MPPSFVRRESLGETSLTTESEKEAPASRDNPRSQFQGLGVTIGFGSKGPVGSVRCWFTALGSLSKMLSVQQVQRLRRETDEY